MSVLLRQPQVGECVLAVKVGDDPRDLASAGVEQNRCPGGHLRDLQSREEVRNFALATLVGIRSA